MRMTIHEIALIATLAGVLLAGAVIKHFRDARRLPASTGAAMATPKPAAERPPYVLLKSNR